VSLKVSVEDTSDSWTFGLTRNDSLLFSAEVTGADTVVRDGGLTPATEYRYRAYWMKNGEYADSSEEVLAVTMDTTSHNFVWTIDTLGDYGSYLNDVAIIDENNVWVVGYIKTDSGTFNAAHWDGEEWELIKVLTGFTANTSIWYFSENNIWITSGLPIHWNGTEWTLFHLWDMGVLGPDDGGVTSVWASSPTNIYFVGRKGSIVHYDGSGFTRMESGTEVDLRDVWGTVNEKTGETVVWASGYDDESPATALLVSRNGQWSSVYDATRYRFIKRIDALSGGVVSA